MENGRSEYNSPLKLQKFLLFYEAFTKLNGDTADFSHLRGYKRGPVFSNVWGDYTHERLLFDAAAQKEYSASREQINIERAKKSKFIVSILSEKELSELTHKMNIWKSQQSRIMQGEHQVDLYEKDFNNDDMHLMQLLDQMYPVSLIDDSYIVEIDNHYFIFSKQDAEMLTEHHFDTLSALSDNEPLLNPVFVEIDEEGILIVD